MIAPKTLALFTFKPSRVVPINNNAGCSVGNPPESKGLHRYNFLGKLNEEVLNEDKQIH